MFCVKCGTKINPGAKFCGVCGAPAPAAGDAAAPSDDVTPATGESGEPGTPEVGSASPGDAGSRAGRMSVALIVVIVVLALATVASAAYLVYTQVVSPNPPVVDQAADDGDEVGADAEENAEAGQDEDADADAESAEEAPAADQPAEEAPAAEAPAAEPALPAAPVETHDYDCEYFSLDVTDSGMSGLSVSGPQSGSGGTLIWQGSITTSNGSGAGFMIYVGGNNGDSSATYQGATSGGLDVYTSTAGGSSIGHGVTLTLK